MSSSSAYKQEHVNFVSSENGTTNGEVLAVLMSCSFLPFLSSLLLPWLIPASFTIRIGQDLLLHYFIRFLVEFPMITLLTGGLVTVLAGEHSSYLPLVITCVLLFTSALMLTVNHTLTRPKWTSLSEEWKLLQNKEVTWNSQEFALKKKKEGGGKFPFVTNLRGMITYITLFTILAVDFPIFPRRFAKTKAFGLSLMDIGTASFIFSNGIVSPEAKSRRPDLYKALLSSWPLLALGFSRLLAIKGTEYHEVVEEYGVHWNFFFTLAAVKILSSAIFSLFDTAAAWKSCIALSVFYESLLTVLNIQNGFILNPSVPRDGSLLAANREGIFSILGYTAMYMGSVYAGQVIYARTRTTFREWLPYLVKMFGLTAILWISFYISHNYWNPTSRRVANLSYILWSLSVSYTILHLHFLLCFVQAVAQEYGILHGPLVSYQLYLKNLKENGRYFERNTGPVSTLDLSKDEELDQSLDNLDKDLQEAMKSKDEVQVSEMLQKIEKKLKRVEKSLDKAENVMNEKSQACLPDLTKSSLFYEAICYNNLAIFLLGNLLTGLVNYTIVTVHSRTAVSVAVLLAYSTAIYFSSFLLYWFNIQLKFW